MPSRAIANSRAKLVSFRRSAPSLTGSFSGISPPRFKAYSVFGTSGDQGANSVRMAHGAGRSAGSPAVGQALRRRLAFFVAPLVAVFLPTVLR